MGIATIFAGGTSMFDMIKKSVFAGIGALAMTEDKIQELIDEFVQKGEISEKEGESLVKDLQQALDEQRTKFSNMVNEQVKNVLHELDLVTKNDLTDLEKNLKKEFSKIDKRLGKMEKQMKESEESS